ncbi:predicted protein [Uncinocarpus reesii 1704]|uniref:Uncharacterized protein n=1 Tax=Uncinocarpus reesii (strain UAMH 1704) TaxID=336963 RepID=C4JWR7_UNCRE|nr:uncharacterized protein UREG_07009 [Uncinocarpus reesii 1704]EEP82144.1 predicted protein [Uncinocarpus reesii 1704]
MIELMNHLVYDAEKMPEKPYKTFTDILALLYVNNLVLQEDLEVSLEQMGNCENVLVQSHGVMQNLSCKHCDEGFSLFTDCVLVPRHLKGACTNCYYNSSGYCCLFCPDAKKRKCSKAATTTTTTTNNTDIKKPMEAENSTVKKTKRLEQKK